MARRRVDNLGAFGVGLSGTANPHWRGGMSVRKDGRTLIYSPGHPRADARQYVLAYILTAEKALGKHLPPRAVVHHLDGNHLNSANSNLVICEDQAYHVYLHARLRAWKACGHADWRLCPRCKAWTRPDQLVGAGYSRLCRSCVPDRETVEERRRRLISEKQKANWARRKEKEVARADTTILYERR